MPPQAAPVSSSPSPFQSSMTPHLHIDNEVCPFCDQDIPPEQLEEISGKIAAREHEQAQAITAKLEQQFATDKAQAEAKAKADLEVERQQSAAREAAAREEARIAAETAANQKLAAAEQSRHEMQTALQKQVTDAEMARKAAEQAGATLQLQFNKLQQDSEMALAEAKADAKARETEIRAEAQQAAQAAMSEKIVAMEASRVESETALQARIAAATATSVDAEKKSAALREQLLAIQQAKDAEIVQLKQVAADEAVRIRAEAVATTEASLREKITATEQLAIEAAEKTREAESKLATLTSQQEAMVLEKLNEQRELLEKAKDDAINAEKAKAFDEHQKLSTRVNELQRALEKKTNEELGEGAEVELFEALKAEFPDDCITRIGKGVQGADMLHVVMLNGKECGTIIYDSKNHGRFLHEHATKLRTDQLAAKADHAILSTRKFPQKTSQLHHHEAGVLVVNPARVTAVVTLIRQHMIQTYVRRVSDAERESKTAALYDFITSDRFVQFQSRVDANTDALLELQVKDKKFHDTKWKKEGELLKQIQKTQADLSNEISAIIGIAAADEPNFESEL
jgi:hypothetical protein